MMTELRSEPYALPAAEIGPENPLPNFRSPQHDSKIDPAAHNIPPEDVEGLGYATGFRVLPWRMQDGYSRRREVRELPSFVLENDVLRVRVLPGVGGKVADIYHKPLERELIYRNPVFQPGNLALRNAWTSGGIEWNTAQIGHHYLACSPVHCARVEGPDGSPVLRIYAWERVKRFPYHIDLHLPPGSPFLFAHVRLINPHDYELPMYWWSNTGMAELDGGRVITPADTTYHGMTVYDCPVIKGLDYSYPTQVRRAYDLFFRIPPERRPWEVYVDRDGRGYVHTSTARLKGRKLFAWGMAQGGRRWGEYLAIPGKPHMEIQAGLMYTQSHSARMPAKSQWTWTEAMGYFEGDAARLHSDDWREAYTEGERVLDEMLPREELERLDAEFAGTDARVPEEVLFRGHGWRLWSKCGRGRPAMTQAYRQSCLSMKATSAPTRSRGCSSCRPARSRPARRRKTLASSRFNPSGRRCWESRWKLGRATTGWAGYTSASWPWKRATPKEQRPPGRPLSHAPRTGGHCAICR